MLKACITDRRYTVDKHTRTHTLITNQTHMITDGTKKKRKKLCRCINMCKCQLKYSSRHIKHNKTHTHQPAAILVFVPTQVCSVKGQALDQRREEEKDEEKEEKRRIQDNLHASFLRK